VGERVHPQGGEKKLGPNLQGKVVSAPKDSEERGNWGDLEVEVVNLVLLACVLMVTTKKGRQLFGARKVHPIENPGYAYG